MTNSGFYWKPPFSRISWRPPPMSRRTNAELREKLFHAYSGDLSDCLPQFNGVFICPLCHKSFDKSSLAKDELALEHCVPRCLGGKTLTLTCKRCNNKHGSKLDAQLLEWREREDHATGLRDCLISRFKRLTDNRIQHLFLWASAD